MIYLVLYGQHFYTHTNENCFKRSTCIFQLLVASINYYYYYYYLLIKEPSSISMVVKHRYIGKLSHYSDSVWECILSSYTKGQRLSHEWLTTIFIVHGEHVMRLN
jgi:hypothetical protein